MENNIINSPPFSILYTGKFYPELESHIVYLHNKYKCDIIYSSFSPPSDLPHTLIITPQDPGPGPIQNLNRRITQVQSALKVCKTDIVFLCRSDILPKKIPIELYNPNILFVSSIMSVLYGYPSPNIANFFTQWSNSNYFCRLGDWFYLAHKKLLKTLYKPFTPQELNLLSKKFPDCSEQYLMYRYYTSLNFKPIFKDYLKFLQSKIKILDLKHIEGFILNSNYKTKTDLEYHNSIKHNMLQNFNYD